jgi:hypothetical protein
MVDYPIDAVIAWVDGEDPVHKAKRKKYGNWADLDNDEVGGDIRFTSVGEIRFCIASLLRFAPFLRKIFVVTDSQDPDVSEFVSHYFPDTKTEIVIVDHKDIYAGYESALPVFNSLSIETMLWRIPGLSEHYVYLNDDFLIISPVTEEDFFQDGKAICYVDPFSVPLARLLRKIKPRRKGHKIFGFKDSMLNAADAVGQKWTFPYIGHIPLAMKRSLQEKFYNDNPEALLSNMSPRFREPHQFNPQVLYYMIGMREGDSVIRPRKGIDLYLKPKNKPGYVQGKLKSFDKADKALFCCFNSLDYASKEDQQLVFDWLNKRLDLK